MKLTYIMAAAAVICMSTSAFAFGGKLEGKGARCQINGVILIAKTADECKTAGGTAMARPGKKTESTESTESSE